MTINIDEERSLRAWTKADQGILEGSLDSDLFEISVMVGRDPFSVGRRIATTICQAQDESLEHGLSFLKWEDPEIEFMGLVLGGAPVSTAISWACGKQDRLPEELIIGMLTGEDFRPALNAAKQRGIWVETIQNLEDMQSLADMPDEIVNEAVSVSLDRLGSLAPADILAIAEGDIAPSAFDPMLRLTMMSDRSCTGARPRKRRRSTRRSSKNSSFKQSWAGTTKVIKAKSRSRYGARS